MNGTYTNGHSALEENAKNTVIMQVYHRKTVENENKPSTEADYKNIAIVRKIIIRALQKLLMSK